MANKVLWCLTVTLLSRSGGRLDERELKSVLMHSLPVSRHTRAHALMQSWGWLCVSTRWVRQVGELRRVPINILANLEWLFIDTSRPNASGKIWEMNWWRSVLVSLQSYSLSLKTGRQRQEAQLPLIMALLRYFSIRYCSPFISSLSRLSSSSKPAPMARSEDTTFLTNGCVCICIVLDTGSTSSTPGHLIKTSTRRDSEANSYTHIFVQEDEESGEATQKEVGCRGGLDRGCLWKNCSLHPHIYHSNTQKIMTATRTECTSVEKNSET